ncbi:MULTISPECIES: PspC domain-containing protein [Virgibacillus]|jgi:phage shock protein C|uniref:PspC domain-containing protein n=1 Tax=Virgibacillus halodenitrificans TaxID=1482 RepID=A0AAC9NLW7_VIRHA|nr:MULTISPECIES: PspC domain-containing protein [Virgibacillus]AIF44137.1 membrane protein [Virgibacillus sp. SK37]APC49119.1 PspC domain-containing protein [Virgibacillus halodenitrificans]MBD1223230.1 PspC domain-containing protein [Virgibacillus halodenitrificans]MCG1026867.1 PspC domain-containing protein [Virgibacillus halodenitrificans]MCJ0932986.1 PspC domain-containing protein [Virgibacillus halodenitrificans]
MKKLYRSSNQRMVAGILGGIAEYFNVDVTILRLIFIILLFFSAFTFAFVYLIAIFIIPNEREIH